MAEPPMPTDDSAISLDSLNPLQVGIVLQLVEDPDLPSSYLAALGFVPGRAVTVLQHGPGGRILLVGVDGTKYVLSVEISRRILVKS